MSILYQNYFIFRMTPYFNIAVNFLNVTSNLISATLYMVWLFPESVLLPLKPRIRLLTMFYSNTSCCYYLPTTNFLSERHVNIFLRISTVGPTTFIYILYKRHRSSTRRGWEPSYIHQTLIRVRI